MKLFKIFIFVFILSTNFINAQDTIICKSEEIIDLKTFMDTYEESLKNKKNLHMTKKIKASKLGSKDEKQDIFFNIYSTSSGVDIFLIYDDYIVKGNEILFMYENDDPKEEVSEQSIRFKIGDEIRLALKNNSLDEMEIIHFLRCKIFPNEPFFDVEKVIYAFKFAKLFLKN